MSPEGKEQEPSPWLRVSLQAGSLEPTEVKLCNGVKEFALSSNSE